MGNASQNNGDKNYLVSAKEILQKRLHKKPSRLLTAVAKKLICEDEVNDCIRHVDTKEGVGFLKDTLNYLDINYEVKGLENLPENRNKKYIFVSNHPLGGPEALIIGEAVRQCFGDNIRFVVNDILSELKPLAPIFVPVNLWGGTQKKELGDQMDHLFKSDNHVLLFPSGKCARKVHGKITEMPWKKMFVTRARKYKMDVIPIYCSGRNSNFFYNISNLGDFLHLKLNVGMMFLVKELFKQKHKCFTIGFGKAIPWQTFSSDKTDLQWASFVRQSVVDMGISIQ